MIEIDNNIINPELLLEKIRKDVLNKESEKINISKKADYIEIKENINRINEKIKTVQLHAGIDLSEPIISNKGIIGLIIVLVKKIIRKSIRWYMKSLIGQQVRFNNSMVSTLNEINKKIDSLILNNNE